MSVAVAPDDVAADHRVLLFVRAVVGAIEGEVAQGLELRFDPIQPAGVGRDVGQLHVVGLGPVAHPGVDLGREVRAEVIQNDGDADVGWVKGAQVAAELQEPGAVLGDFDVAIHLVRVQVVGRQEVPDAVFFGCRWLDVVDAWALGLVLVL